MLTSILTHVASTPTRPRSLGPYFGHLLRGRPVVSGEEMGVLECQGIATRDISTTHPSQLVSVQGRLPDGTFSSPNRLRSACSVEGSREGAGTVSFSLLPLEFSVRLKLLALTL